VASGGTWSRGVGTVAFQGIEAVPVDVQVMVAPGKMGISMYGLIKLECLH
jgi:magnesium chelatase family protein